MTPQQQLAMCYKVHKNQILKSELWDLNMFIGQITGCELNFYEKGNREDLQELKDRLKDFKKGKVKDLIDYEIYLGWIDAKDPIRDLLEGTPIYDLAQELEDNDATYTIDANNLIEDLIEDIKGEFTHYLNVRAVNALKKGIKILTH